MDFIEYGAVIAAITQLVKQMDVIESKFLPLISVFVGIGIGIVDGGATVDAVIKGLVLGLSTTGLVGVTKDTLAKIGK